MNNKTDDIQKLITMLDLELSKMAKDMLGFTEYMIAEQLLRQGFAATPDEAKKMMKDLRPEWFPMFIKYMHSW